MGKWIKTGFIILLVIYFGLYLSYRNGYYINKNSVDLISCIMDYIKDNIFNENLEKIFTLLEHHNFLTTLKQISNKSKLDKGIIERIKNTSTI